ncbi:PhnD/SsuA/transferrin family substrate-binding protein [Acerihabitans sp. KWT182]|uniref:PhnD/SsuA/transferrin family substrate-binding protein n=1 Tax=Acerihabitans sp. KWT182 TaxID=3157919 RepID=A0AAU7QFM2_9GAMM
MSPASLVSLPMYAVSRADVEAQWQTLRQSLERRGLPVAGVALQWPADLIAHWRDPRLLLSQTCGYPLVTMLPNVRPVGCFHYDAPGCEGIGYRSFILTRDREKGASLADFKGRRAVCNSADSQSGFHALRGMVRRITGGLNFFSAVNFSGSHENSLAALQRGTADVAAVDCVTYALLQRHRPARIRSLKIIAQSPLTPGLPLITHRLQPPPRWPRCTQRWRRWRSSRSPERC